MRLNEINNKGLPQLFLDCDGVLADFDKRAMEILGVNDLSNVPDPVMWSALADTVFDPGSEYHNLLKMLQGNRPKNHADLGFVKKQGTKKLNTLVRSGLINKTRDELFTLSEKGREVLTTLEGGERFVKGPNFFDSLDKMPDADKLLAFARAYNPVVLTGAPRGNWAQAQKERWVKREIDLPVIVCMAREKAEKAAAYMGTQDLNGAVLVDDRPKYQKTWEANGGVWITHTSAENSIALLKGLGF